MEKKDTFKMTEEELTAHFKSLRVEYDKNPRKANEEFNKVMDLSSYYLDPDPNVQDMEHVKKTEKQLMDLAGNDILTKEERTTILKQQKARFILLLKKIELSGDHVGTFTDQNSGKDVRVHIQELRYYTDVVIDYLISHLDTLPNESHEVNIGDDVVSHRFLFLDKLGIIDHLRDKYPGRKQARMVDILCFILFGDTTAHRESIKLYYRLINTKKPRDPAESEEAVNAVNGTLTKLGLK